jgi:hypothetical protein
MSSPNVPIPPRIPGDASLKTLEVQTLKVEDDLVVEGDITCNSLTATTFVHAGTNVIAATGMTSTTGNIVATIGSVSAGTTVTGGTGITATTGNITAVTGSLISNTANVNAATGCNIGFGVVGPVLNLGSNATSGAVVRIADAVGLVGFYGKTAIVQPTTAIAPAAYVANAGIDTATFGGYTIGQIVAALRALGELA